MIMNGGHEVLTLSIYCKIIDLFYTSMWPCNAHCVFIWFLFDELIATAYRQNTKHSMLRKISMIELNTPNCYISFDPELNPWGLDISDFETLGTILNWSSHHKPYYEIVQVQQLSVFWIFSVEKVPSGSDIFFWTFCEHHFYSETSIPLHIIFALWYFVSKIIFWHTAFQRKEINLDRIYLHPCNSKMI